MYAVAAFGLLTIVLSCMMIASPAGWSSGILVFCEKPYFHVFEVSVRLMLGGVLLYFADQTVHPRVIAAVGYLLVAVGIGLLLLGQKRHRAFAVRSANFVGVFRAAGVASFAFGVFVVYSALAWKHASH